MDVKAFAFSVPDVDRPSHGISEMRKPQKRPTFYFDGRFAISWEVKTHR